MNPAAICKPTLAMGLPAILCAQGYLTGKPTLRPDPKLALQREVLHEKGPY